MGPEVAAAAAIGGLALEAGSSIVGAEGEAASQEFMAARDKRSAELGRLKAGQTDAQLREELNTTLANIQVTRAAANTDPLSPTGLAILENESRISDRARNIKVASIRAQASEDDASAAYRLEAAKTARLAGYLGAGGKALKGLGSLGKK